MGAVIDHEGARRADLAAIHIAKKDLGWDDGTYRDVMFAVCRVRSSAELDFAGRKRWLAHLKACGWKKGVAARSSGSARRAPLTPSQRKVWSLWQELADAGLVRDRGMPALAAYVKRQTGVDRLEWLAGRQEELVIESLKRWLVRGPEGVA